MTPPGKRDGYWQIETSTAGYENVYLFAQTLFVQKGPASMTLQYSTDGKTMYHYFTITRCRQAKTVHTTQIISFRRRQPISKKYISALAYSKTKRANDSDPLFNNESKGNTYITKLAITGDRSSSLKMPYTTKSTAYFGSNGKITYISPDDAVMKYSIYTKNGTTIAENREYDSTKGISLAALSAFDALLLQPVQG